MYDLDGQLCSSLLTDSFEVLLQKFTYLFLVFVIVGPACFDTCTLFFAFSFLSKVKDVMDLTILFELFIL